MKSGKKLKTIGIVAVSAILLVCVAGIILVLVKNLGGDGGESIFDGIVNIEPEQKYKEFAWQTGELSADDVTAEVVTTAGSFTLKLTTGEAAERFIALAESGAFNGAEFSTLAEDMFIQTGAANSETAQLESAGLGCFYGAVGFALDGGAASTSLFVVTAKELSGLSKAYLEQGSFDDEYKAYYEENGGCPEYEGKTLVFGQVVSGFDVVEKIAAGENSGYTGGYAAADPASIVSVTVARPSDEKTAE